MTIKIVRLSMANEGDVVCVDILVEQGENSERNRFKLLSSQYAGLRLKRGEISRQTYEEIEEASRICDAYIRGLNILSFGSNTARTLELKLRRRGFDSSAAGAAIELLRTKGYLNENEDIVRELERCLRKLWGKSRIIAHLHQRGYEDEAIFEAEEMLSEIDFAPRCLEKLYSCCDDLPGDIKERQKLIASLCRYGYSMSDIKYAFAHFDT